MRPKSDSYKIRREMPIISTCIMVQLCSSARPEPKNLKNRKGNQPLRENAEMRFSRTHTEIPTIMDLLVERKTQVTFLRKRLRHTIPQCRVPPKRRERDSLKTFLETFGSLFEVTNRQPYAPVGTVSGANVIGTLCDIVTREHTTVSP